MPGDKLDKISSAFLDHKKFLTSFHKDEKYYKDKLVNADFGSTKLNGLRDQVRGLWQTQEKIESFLDAAQGTQGRPEFTLKKHREAIEKYNETIGVLEKKRDDKWAELEEDFKGEKCVGYLKKAVEISSSSHKKIMQEKRKHLELLNSDLKADLNLKNMLPKDFTATDPIFMSMNKDNPTLGDYIKKRESLVSEGVTNSRAQKEMVLKSLTADLEPGMDLAVGLIEDTPGGDPSGEE
jgi:hypothetical protein